jgi:hypothetical protein
MTATKLRNIIAKRISKLEDIDKLEAIYQILDSMENDKNIYELSEIQRKKIQNSKLQFKEGQSISNEKVFEEIG